MLTRGFAVAWAPMQPPKHDDVIEWIIPLGDWPEADLTWYVDASGLDPHDPHMLRLGFGIIALDSAGILRVAAHGRPPHYVRSVPACECYAAAVVLSKVVTCRQLVTDCLANVLLAREGGGKARDTRRCVKRRGSVRRTGRMLNSSL